MLKYLFNKKIYSNEVKQIMYKKPANFNLFEDNQATVKSL